MTEEQLAQYMTVAEKNKIFVEEFQPKGMFMKTKHYWRSTSFGEIVVFETEILGRNSKGKEFMLANGSAAENMSINASRSIDPFRFCETSSRGRALAALGIGLENGMSSRDDLDCGINYTGENAKQSKVELPSAEDTVKRLKVDYIISDGFIIVPISNLKARTISVLERYNFVKREKDLVRAL